MDKRRIVFFTGAGVSAESGIATFRDSGGLWDGHDIAEVAHVGSWVSKSNRDAKREVMLDFYNKRRRELEHVEPNGAHLAISALADSERFRVDVVTQNVDNLHERAGSSNVLHLHGELTKARITYYDHKSSNLDTIIDIGYNDINLGDKCPQTGSQLRPHVVWFGEDVPAWSDAVALIKGADVLVIVGTSLQVYPAATVLEYAETDNIIFVNPVIEDEYKEDPRYVCFENDATVGVPLAIRHIVDEM